MKEGAFNSYNEPRCTDLGRNDVVVRERDIVAQIFLETCMIRRLT